MSDANEIVVRTGKRVKELPSRKFLNECFEYNPDTGELKWKVRPVHHFSSEWASKRVNSTFAGKVAGSPTEFGILVGVGGTGRFLAHRLIAVMLEMEIGPDQEVDHKNGRPCENRSGNLRACTPQQNRCNTISARRVNTTLPKGVHPNGKKGYMACIKLHRKQMYLGTFKTIEEARSAYISAAEKHHGEFAHIHSTRQGEPSGSP